MRKKKIAMFLQHFLSFNSVVSTSILRNTSQGILSLIALDSKIGTLGDTDEQKGREISKSGT